MDKEAMKLLAEKHSDEVEVQLIYETMYSYNNRTVIRNASNIGHLDDSKVRTKSTVVRLLDTGSVEAAFEAGQGKTCILNFASYKHPGGGFIKGMYAQEEALCHCSNLYNVLVRCNEEYYTENQKDLNRGLYRHSAIYTPDIVFWLGQDKVGKFDVVTCAAPNWNAQMRCGKSEVAENNRVLHQRVGFVLGLMEKNNADTIVIGAWGCGVFKQDPNIVAQSMRYWLEHSDVASNIIIAIPDKDSDNYKAFERIFADIL